MVQPMPTLDRVRVVPQTSRRFRAVATLVLAVLGPFGLVWLALSAQGLWRGRLDPGGPSGVTHFSDLITPAAPDPARVLSAGRELWTGTAGSRKAWFNDLQVVASSVALVSDERLLALDRHTGVPRSARELVRDAPDLGAVTALALSHTQGAMWLYSFGTGTAVEYLADGTFGHRTVVERELLSVNEVAPGRLAGTGLFERELVRIFGPESADASRVTSSLKVVARLGGPLFMGLESKLSRQLNTAVAAVAPDGSRLAVANRWSSRIQIFDLRTHQLERAIAGPVETKLNFAMAPFEGRQEFTFSDESTYSYVDVAATAHRIVALYSGRERRRYPGRFGLGAELHVFTWDGRLVGIWHLPQAVQKIRIDPEESTLYTLRADPVPTVTAYSSAPMLVSR